MSNKSGTSSQAITLPSGGGALSGIGETFSPDLFTGTGNFTVPIEVPPGRNGFQPGLSLTYSTGDGNGPFGLGWSVSVPSVTRKTSDGVPRYADGSADAQDTFVLSGSEDLVPIAESESGVTRFRPRTEGLFARIDRMRGDGDMWRVSTTDGLVSTYGGGAEPAVVADPADRSRVFRWLLSHTTDPFGNRIAYTYRRDSGTDGPHEWDQLYLEKVEYVDYDRDGETRFLVSVTFVYDERLDPFSEHRAGFEIRTRLRCRRIEVRTHANEDLLTRTYELEYLDDLVGNGERPASDLPLNGVSLLTRIRVVGHDADQTEALPPLEFGYSRFAPERQRFQPIEADGDALPTVSLANADHETVDLFGNGLPDIVQMNGSLQYWRNLGGGRFDRPREMAEVPAGVRLAEPGVQFADMNGDGRADLLVLSQHGYFPLAFGGEWSARGFVQYPVAPSVTFGADDIRLVDLDGDGVVDALRTGSAFELYFNDAERGWERVETRPRRPAAEFPDVTFTDARVKLADLNGDGLQDIVLVDQGRLDYWPYLGHGNWGRRVRMEASPVFRDDPPLPGTGFDPRRVLFGDLDGDGLDDIVYVQADRITCWINQGGERWSEPFDIDGTPPFTDIDGVRVTDMLGTGMGGVLWTAEPIPGTGSHYRFLDLTGGSKPYLLNRMNNNMGAVTDISYATSTGFYLADEDDAATRWKTPLPFPVHVVERVEVIDQISGGKLTNEFRYHDGYWDGFERELRGFGMVEQLDSETFTQFHAGSQAAGFVAVDAQQFSPPLLTKTWFHQGPTGDEFEDFDEPDRSAEYWRDDPPALGHVESVNAFLAPLPRSVRRDALRSLRGSVLRTELYARDGSDREDRPVTVTEHAYGLREDSATDADADGRRHIFFPHNVAKRTTQWERGTDPMTGFTFTDDYDAFGQPRRVIDLAVPRGRDYRQRSTDAEPYLGTMTSTTFAQRNDESRFIVDRVARTATHEIRNDGSQTVFELRDALHTRDAELAIIGQTLSYYDGRPFEGLGLGELGDFGAAARTEMLVLTPEILAEAYRDEAGRDGTPPYLAPGETPSWTDEYPEEFRSLLPELAGYAFTPGGGGGARGYFAQTARNRYDVQSDTEPADAAGRGLLVGTRDPMGRDTTIEYDAFDLLPVKSTDTAALTTQAEYDYRVLQPRLATDVNGNRTAFAFTPLGLLERMAVMGRQGEPNGDTLDTPGTHYVYHLDVASAVAAGARRPVSVRSVRRVHHVNDSDVPLPGRDETIEMVEYSDGFGRLVQTRVQAEDVMFGDLVFGGNVMPADQDDPATQHHVMGRLNDDPGRPNVVVNGWQIYDNKGRVVEKYEPFFATGREFATPGETQLGQRIMMFYDGQGRLVRTLGADGSEERVVHGVPVDLADPDVFTPSPWEIFTYDQNDNAGRTHPADANVHPHHWNTPSSTLVDAMGRAIVTIQRNRPAPNAPDDPMPAIEEVRTEQAYDVRGNPVRVIDALGRSAFRYTYDLADQVIRTENIDARVERTVIDAGGGQVERRDSKGALVLEANDRLGRKSRLWARDDSASVVTLRERIEYGDEGDPEQPAPRRAAARAANRLGKLERHYDEAGLSAVETYDFKGNALEQTRRVIADEQLLAAFPAAGDASPDWAVAPVRIDWQPRSAETLDELADRLLDPREYRTSSVYDAIDRVVTRRCPAGTGDARRELNLGYDRSGALDRVDLDGEPVVEQIVHDANGQRTLVALANGVMTRFANDRRTARLLRLRSERYERAAGTLDYRPTGRALQDFAYAYDLQGNILSIVDRTPGSGVAGNPDAALVDDATLRSLVASGDALIRVFEYDPLDRLLSANGRECKSNITVEPWVDGPHCGFNSGKHGTPNQDNAPSLTRVYRQNFRYDVVGNLLRLDHVAQGSNTSRTFELVAASNRLRSTARGQTVIDYAYDAAGNLARETTSRHFEWDHSNRMKAFRTQAGASEPSVHAQYLYDAAGERVKKLVRKQGGGIEVTTYIDGVFEHHRRSAPGGDGDANTTVHVVDGDQHVALVREGTPYPDDRGPAVQYVLGDHLGSSNLTVDGDAGFINREELTPYGATSFGSFGRKRYRFMGKERDEESGLAYHGARYYAPWLARWSSCDPAHAESSRRPEPSWNNLYSAFALNPARHVDPDGRDPQERPKAPSRFVRWRVKAQLIMRLKLPDLIADPGHWGPAGDKFAELSQDVKVGLESSRERKPKGELPGPPDPPTHARPTGTGGRGAGGGATVPGGGRGSGAARGALGLAGKGARLIGSTVSGATVAIPVVHRSFMAGTYLRQGEYRKAARQAPLLIEDLSPVPSGRPDKISYPELGPDQSAFRDRIDSPDRSGCQICHDAVRVDNFFKTTAEGQQWELLNGPTARDGFPTDRALEFFERNAFPLNPR